jgi:very-short-patch-repair endonuclease
MKKLDFSLVDKRCLNCGCKLLLKVSRDVKRKNFCSRSCGGSYRGKIVMSNPELRKKILERAMSPESSAKKGLKGEKHPNWVGKETRSCKLCNCEFQCRITSERKYCSFKCSLKDIHSKNRIDRVEKIEYSCLVCSKKFKRSVNYKQNPKYCSYRCNGIDSCRNTASDKGRTDIENLVHDLLVLMNLPFEEQININNISVVDFKVGNLLIFADGDYWHNLPGRREKDFEQSKKLEDIGYSVLRFTGSLIKSDINQVHNEIKKIYGKRN